MAEATGRITWGKGAGEGLRIITIRSPDVLNALAVLVSSQKAPVRHAALPGETEDEFKKRVTHLGKQQGYVEQVKIFLPMLWRMVRVRLCD